MEDDFAVFDADNAVNITSEHFTKYRAVEVFSSEVGVSSFSLLHSAPSHKSEVFIDERKLYTSVSDSVSHSKITLMASSSAPSSSSGPRKPIICPEKPFFVTRENSVCLKGVDFSRIQCIVEKVLNGLKDYDWSFVPSETLWKCKYFQGSNVREISIKCFWNAPSEEYFLEVKRVNGDGLLGEQNSTADILNQLRNEFGQSEGKVLRKGGKLRGALPLPAGLKSAQTKEQFLQGIEPVLKMAGSPNFESRLEASRMLCDLATNSEKSLLTLPECQDLCFQILELLLHDNEEQSEQVKQFALMAFGLLAEYDCYQECFLHFKDFYQIIRLVDNAPANKPSCECIQMRRQAAKGLSLLVKKAADANSSVHSAKLSLCKQLQGFGYLDDQHWKHHCNSLRDERLKTYALAILPCFQ